MMTTEFQAGDWVKCPGKGKILWVYGRVKSVHNLPPPRGIRVCVDRCFSEEWFSPSEISLAYPPQSAEEVKAIREALNKVAGKDEARQ